MSKKQGHLNSDQVILTPWPIRRESSRKNVVSSLHHNVGYRSNIPWHQYMERDDNKGNLETSCLPVSYLTIDHAYYTKQINQTDIQWAWIGVTSRGMPSFGSNMNVQQRNHKSCHKQTYSSWQLQSDQSLDLHMTAWTQSSQSGGWRNLINKALLVRKRPTHSRTAFISMIAIVFPIHAWGPAMNVIVENVEL